MRRFSVATAIVLVALGAAACSTAATSQDPAQSESAPSESAPSEPELSDLALSDLALTEPELSELSEPELSELPELSEPAPSDPAPTETATVEPGAAEQDCASEYQPTFTTSGSASGNRVLAGSTDLLASTPMVVDLTAPAAWIVDDPRTPGDWVVVLEDRTVIYVLRDGTVIDSGFPSIGPLEVRYDGSYISVGSAWNNHALFVDPLPDTWVTEGISSGVAAALVRPTDRYGHGVLGDRIEASAIELVNRCTQERTRIEVDAPSVVEGLSVILADVTGDGADDVIATLSNADVGAWLAVYDMAGHLVAESDPIGRGNRWRNQLAVAPTGPDGETEVIDVRVPHIGGQVEFFQYRNGRLEMVATAPGEFTTHVNGSRNLDMGIVLDATGDGHLNVVVPTQDRRQLGVLRRTGDAPSGVAIEGLIDLDGGTMVSNVGSQATEVGPWLAVGTSDSRLLVFPPN